MLSLPRFKAEGLEVRHAQWRRHRPASLPPPDRDGASGCIRMQAADSYRVPVVSMLARV